MNAGVPGCFTAVLFVPFWDAATTVSLLVPVSGSGAGGWELSLGYRAF